MYLYTPLFIYSHWHLPSKPIINKSDGSILHPPPVGFRIFSFAPPPLSSTKRFVLNQFSGLLRRLLQLAQARVNFGCCVYVYVYSVYMCKYSGFPSIQERDGGSWKRDGGNWYSWFLLKIGSMYKVCHLCC